MPYSLVYGDAGFGVAYRFAFRLPIARQSAVRNALEREGVPARPGVAFLTPNASAFPAAETLASEVLTLPTYPALTDDEVEGIATALTNAVGGVEWSFSS